MVKFAERAEDELRRIPLPRLSDKSGLAPNWWPRACKNGAKKPCLAMLGPRDARSRRPSAIYQTVSPRTWVNMDKREGLGHLTPALRQLQGFGILWGISLRCRWPRPGRRGLRCRPVCRGR